MAPELAPMGGLNVDLGLTGRLSPPTRSAPDISEGIAERKLVGERITVLTCHQGSPETYQMGSIGPEGGGPRESEAG